jgi:hypothetical protein
MSPIPPKNSAAMAKKAKGAGICTMLVKAFIVGVNPNPPNQPNIFCAPWMYDLRTKIQQFCSKMALSIYLDVESYWSPCLAVIDLRYVPLAFRIGVPSGAPGTRIGLVLWKAAHAIEQKAMRSFSDISTGKDPRPVRLPFIREFLLTLSVLRPMQ